MATMVSLVPMSESDFTKQLQKWIKNYVQEKVTSGNWKEEVAENLSRE